MFPITQVDIDTYYQKTIYRFFNTFIKGGQELIILRNNEFLMVGRQVFKDLVYFY